MTGWLMYSKADVSKNKIFIELLQREFLTLDITLVLKIYEELHFDSMAELPDFAINRSRFYDIAEHLESFGIRVFNHSSVSKITNDKLACYRHLQDIVPVLPAISAKQYRYGMYEYPIVIKSCAGHGGNEVFLATKREDELQAIQQLKGKDYLVQKCCNNPGRDVRVYILGNEIIAAVLRTSANSFKSNYSLGGKVSLYSLSETEKSTVASVLCKLDLDYAGIDFIFHNGSLVFNEIEDVVGARMLYEVSDINIIKLFAEYVSKELRSPL